MQQPHENDKTKNPEGQLKKHAPVAKPEEKLYNVAIRFS